MSTALTTRAHLGALVTSAATLGRVLEHAHFVQWDRPRLVDADRTSDRSRRVIGSHDDPTAALALDGSRLRLRETVAAAERAIESAAWRAEAAHRNLTAALACFYDDDETR
jgi:hypothetical protein